MKKILHLTVFLALIAALAGGALAFANNMTAPVIAANELAAEKENLKIIYPDVSDDAFEVVEKDVSETIEKIFSVEGKGYIFKMNVVGYDGGTSFLVALNEDGTVYDYVAISNGDTKGLGSKVTEQPFRDSLKGKDATTDEILDDVITGATLSSKPILEGIQEAAKYQADKLQ
ncbi:FMN-binding protein [Erysipelotrichaceae bacterium HCN-30851]